MELNQTRLANQQADERRKKVRIKCFNKLKNTKIKMFNFQTEIARCQRGAVEISTIIGH